MRQVKNVELVTIRQQLASLWPVKTQYQVYDGRLACTARPDKRHRLPRVDHEVYILQDVLVRFVAEGDLLETDLATQMAADAGALAELTLLALGTFTAGVHIAAWRICLVGVIMAAGVPGIAWLEQSALLLVLLVLVAAAIIVPFVWRWRKGSKTKGDPLPATTD